MCWAIPIPGVIQGNFVSNEASTKVNKQLGDTGALQTLAKGDKLTVTVERVDDGKLRWTGATWSDAVVIFPDEVLAFQNIERQNACAPGPCAGHCGRNTPLRRHPIRARTISRGEDTISRSASSSATPLPASTPEVTAQHNAVPGRCCAVTRRRRSSAAPAWASPVGRPHGIGPSGRS